MSDASAEIDFKKIIPKCGVLAQASHMFASYILILKKVETRRYNKSTTTTTLKVVSKKTRHKANNRKQPNKCNIFLHLVQGDIDVASCINNQAGLSNVSTYLL
jgi:hypothetical protein